MCFISILDTESVFFFCIFVMHFTFSCVRSLEGFGNKY